MDGCVGWMGGSADYRPVFTMRTQHAAIPARALNPRPGKAKRESATR